MARNKNIELQQRNTDVISIFYLSKEVGWKGISKISISRIFYFSASFYTFINPLKKNIFQDLYRFSIDFRGPICVDIDQSITDLLSKEYVQEKENEYFLNVKEYNSDINEILSIKDNDKYNWIKSVIYILALYGEDKIYDFIFRDPEYQDSYKSNSNDNLDIGSKSKTVETLNEFKEAFENNLLKNNEYKPNDIRYLELYFEYVFSKILKGEIELYDNKK